MIFSHSVFISRLTGEKRLKDLPKIGRRCPEYTKLAGKVKEKGAKNLIGNIDFFCRWNRIRPVGQIMEIFGRAIREGKNKGGIHLAV
jgi:hypothetical protein